MMYTLFDFDDFQRFNKELKAVDPEYLPKKNRLLQDQFRPRQSMLGKKL